MSSEGYLSSDEAAQRLGVKKSTLYTYASRGLIRLVAAPDGKRRMYLAADVERIRVRGQAHRGEVAGASSALQWGQPVIDSKITFIDRDGPYYRGVSATGLAERKVSFERTAELLWTGKQVSAAPNWTVAKAGLPLVALVGLVPAGTPPMAVLQVVLPALAVADPLRFGAPEPADLQRARVLIRRLTALLALACPRPDDWRDRVNASLAAPSVAVAFARAAGLDDSCARGIDLALVLCADHELNASAFAGRVAASTGADLYGSVGAALATLTGPKHGGMSDRVEAMLAGIVHPQQAAQVLGGRLGRGEPVPGFGHPLYPDGDPRAEAMLAWSERNGAGRIDVPLAVLKAMRVAGHPLPNLDFGLVTLSRAIGLPPGWAAALFAIGRVAGWVAHAREQKDTSLIRPRARYVGETPGG